MDNAQRLQLETYGVNWEDAMERFGGNTAFYFKLLARYTEKAYLEQMKQSLEAGDENAAYEACHTLKGVAGNLSLTPLFEVASAACVAFREGNPEAARNMIPQLETHHALAREAASLAKQLQ
ncbi:MAG: Hpt domain-containing protein [Coriobacteriia bacterium]|nr:Hpt domain-containing protein [Coriobacteriia bacterium]